MRAGIDALYERLAAEGKSESDDESSGVDSDDDDFLSNCKLFGTLS